MSYPFSKPSNLLLSLRVKLDDPPPPSLSLSSFRILKEAGQADNLAVLLLVGRSLAFYMLKATVRQPFSSPSTHACSPRSLVFHPTAAAAALFRAATTDPPSRTGGPGFPVRTPVSISTAVFSLFSHRVYTLIICPSRRCYGIQRTAIYEFDRKHDDYARPIGVFLCTKER